MNKGLQRITKVYFIWASQSTLEVTRTHDDEVFLHDQIMGNETFYADVLRNFFTLLSTRK